MAVMGDLLLVDGSPINLSNFRITGLECDSTEQVQIVVVVHKSGLYPRLIRHSIILDIASIYLSAGSHEDIQSAVDSLFLVSHGLLKICVKLT